MRSQSPIDDGVVLLTGASSGIGAAMAAQLAPRARALVLVARRADRLEALAAGLRAAHPRLEVDVEGVDLTDPAAPRALVARALHRHGRLDVLINNAGMGDIGLLHECPEDKLLQMLQTNVVGLTLLTRAALGPMLAAGRGAVLQVSSGFGLTWAPFFSAYVGTKHHVSAMTEALRAELAGSGLRIVQLCPGPVATEFEQVAGNPTGQRVPAFIELSAAACAAAGIRAIDRDRAVVLPGLVAALGIWAGAQAPRWLLRAVYGLAGRALRPRFAGRRARSGSSAAPIPTSSTPS
jgi:short-subunit dehydrogenase